MSTKIVNETMHCVLARMSRLDAFYCDKHFAAFSRVRLPGYFTFSENLARKYPGFILNDTTGLIENLSNLEINLDTLLGLLKSKDLDNYERIKDKIFTH